MPFKIGPWELVLIVLLVFIIFGAGKLPAIFKEIGKGIKSLRQGVDDSDVDDSDDKVDN